ncbi:zinc-binding dehydrogenase [Albibacterium profundi]|uniref:Zinc-binding dehydrogenase n=1 Tax=Albibacterium profundi TaxID=3134906 RepID=A0ABV5CHJ9_9SPHI
MGAGAVGQMAVASAWLKGASRVICIDKYDYRLSLVAENCNGEVLNYTSSDIQETLKEATGGRGPDVCIDAVGMEANSQGLQDVYDKVKQQLKLESDRPAVLRQALTNCRKGGTVSIVGVYSGLVDKFPVGVMINKSLTIKSGMVHAQKYIPTLLDHVQKGDIDPTYLKTHEFILDHGNYVYELFAEHRDSCLRAVFVP